MKVHYNGKCLQEAARKLTLAAAKHEATLRSKLSSQLKAKIEGAEPRAKKAKLSRAQMKLENCPGINQPSLSGKIMKPLTTIWKQEPKKEEALTPEAPSPDMKIRDITGQDYVSSGLVGMDSTFTFSPRDSKDGKSKLRYKNYKNKNSSK